MTRTEKMQIKKTIKTLKPAKLSFERRYNNECETLNFSFCYCCEDGDAIVYENGVYYGYINDWTNYMKCLNFTADEINSEILRNAVMEA